MDFFFFGLGYSSLATARSVHEFVDADAAIAGTTRSPENAADLAERGYRAHLFDGEVPGDTLVPDLHAASRVVLSIPPDERGDPAFVHHAGDLVASPSLEWLCYFSTVGVYGDFDGAWIDEAAPHRPVNSRSMQRIRAEQAWTAFAAERGVPMLVLRLAGIYGPGRSAFDRLREGTARRIIKPGQVFNRIHVGDIGRVTALAAQRKLSGTFNLADDEPAPPQNLVSRAAALMGVPEPPGVPFEEAHMTEMARSFYSDNKRVSNAAIKQALGIELLYPTYREGLEAIWRQRV